MIIINQIQDYVLKTVKSRAPGAYIFYLGLLLVSAGQAEESNQANLVQAVVASPGFDTVLRQAHPHVAQGIYSAHSIRSRQIERSRRVYTPVLRFTMPDRDIPIRNALIRVFVTQAGINAFNIDVYGVRDGSLGDQSDKVAGMTWNTAPWNSSSAADEDLHFLGSIEYRANQVGKLELRDTPELVNFLNNDSNGAVTFVFKPQPIEGEETGFQYLSSWEAEFEGRFRPTLELVYQSENFLAGDRFFVPILERCDPETGFKVRQVSFLPGASQIFYYHYNPVSECGNWIIYRHIEGERMETSRRTLEGHQYFKVDPQTGETIALTDQGFVSSGDLRGEWFYFIRQDDDVFRVSRLHIDTLELQDLFVWAPPGYPEVPYKVEFKDPYANLYFKANGLPDIVVPLFDGNLSVNADGSKLVLNMRLVNPGHDVRAIDSVDTSSIVFALDPNSGEVRELFSAPIRVSHLQCSPTDPDIYHFMENNPGILPEVYSRTRHLLFGSIETGAWGPLITGDSFVDSFRNFAHPWWGADGRFWSDTMVQTEGDRGGFVGAGVIAFELSAPPEGPFPAIWEIEGFTWFDGDNVEWQHHYNRTHLPEWHIGEGADPRGHRAGRRGRPFIQIFHAPNGAERPTYFNLCRQHWTRYIGIAGYSGANPHFIPEYKGIVFQDWLDLQGLSMRTMNVMVVEMPEKIVKKMQVSELNHE